MNNNKLQIFEPLFDVYEYEKLDQEFHNFFYKYGLLPLFTNEHRAGQISYHLMDARSVVNEGGKYSTTLKEFADFVNVNTHAKRYEDALFKIVYHSRTFQMFINNIKRVIELILSLTDPKHIRNMWNVVFYADNVIR